MTFPKKRTYTVLGRPKKNRCIVVLMDGTWNDETGKDGDGVVTNIVKLFRCFRPDSEKQLVRYFRGVGNDEENDWWGIKRGGAFGTNEKRIRDHAYSTIVKEYHPGDRIFIFGFSRGAASARMLAGQLQKEGIPETITIETEPKANNFTHHVEDRFAGYERSDKTAHQVDVDFLGVWDTVGAFGIPISLLGIPFQKINLFNDMHVSPNVKKAVHLVSVDETRDPFVPTLMNRKPGVVEEVWFPGVHSDVGGGYEHDQLGRITLCYMIERLRAHVAELDGYGLELDDPTVQTSTKRLPETRFHFHGLGWKKGMREVFVQQDDKPCDLPPRIHHSVFDLQRNREVYSVVRKKRRFLRKVKAVLSHIIYNPLNLRGVELEVEENIRVLEPATQPLDARPDVPADVESESAT